jgi:hypothetical protein
LTKISVDRWAWTSSSRRGWIAGQIDRRAGPAAAGTADRLALDDPAEVAHVVDRHDHLDVQRLGHPGVDDRDRAGAGGGHAGAVVEAAEVTGHDVERPLGGGQADALGRPFADVGQALERQRQVRAALGGHQRVDLVDDHGLDPAQRVAGLGREHEVERLGRGDEDVGRVADELAAHVGRRVAGAQPDGGLAERLAQPLGRGPDAGDRRPQVLVDVDGQRPQRRHVDDAGAGRVGAAATGGVSGLGPRGATVALHQTVDAPQERGERLARSCRGEDQRVVAARDGRPPLLLRGGGRREARLEPRPHGRREPGEDHDHHRIDGV